MSEIDEKLAEDAARLPDGDNGALSTVENPSQRIDFLTRVEGKLKADKGGTVGRVTLRYIADKRLLSVDSFHAYLAERDPDLSPEGLAARLLRDINNEVVPRWIQLRIEWKDRATLVEDRQPKWDNPALLARIEPF